MPVPYGLERAPCDVELGLEGTGECLASRRRLELVEGGEPGQAIDDAVEIVALVVGPAQMRVLSTEDRRQEGAGRLGLARPVGSGVHRIDEGDELVEEPTQRDGFVVVALRPFVAVGDTGRGSSGVCVELAVPIGDITHDPGVSRDSLPCAGMGASS